MKRDLFPEKKVDLQFRVAYHAYCIIIIMSNKQPISRCLDQELMEKTQIIDILGSSV